jgi:hypothetical protein
VDERRVSCANTGEIAEEGVRGEYDQTTTLNVE